jgi:hypothetical protein
MSGWIYALLCLILPIIWGLIVLWASGRIEAWRQKHFLGDAKEQNPISPDYHI